MRTWPGWILLAPAYGDHLYRLYDADGVLLYLGLSGAPRSRLKDHWDRKPWRDEIASASFQELGPAGPGEIPGLHRFMAEAKAIAEEQPRYNIAGVTRPYWVYDL